VFDVDADDALRASQPSTLHCHEAHWSAAKDRDRLATLQLRPIDCRVSGRQNVGKEKHFFIAKVARHFAGSEVCIGHADVFCLATLVAAVKVCIAKEPAAFLIQKSSFGTVFIRIRLFAVSWQPALAEETGAADGSRCDRRMISSACSISGSSTLSTETLPALWKTTAFINNESSEVGIYVSSRGTILTGFSNVAPGRQIVHEG
jgi:hypothetical protein